jgi:hypothetical protein
MKLILAFLCSLLAAGSLSAQGVYNMAKQQAKNVANGGSPQPGASAPAGAPQYFQAPPDPALQATMQNIHNLNADFGDLDSHPTNTAPLIKDLTDAAHGAKASPESVSKLAGDLAAAIAGNAKIKPQHPKLSQYVHAAFNGSHLTPVQQQAVLAGVKKILSDGGVPDDDAAKVISDLKAIATETK